MPPAAGIKEASSAGGIPDFPVLVAVFIVLLMVAVKLYPTLVE